MTDRTKAVILASAHSLWITATAVASGILADAYVNGQADTPAHLIAFVKVHWLASAIAILVAPSIRARRAAKGVS